MPLTCAILSAKTGKAISASDRSKNPRSGGEIITGENRLQILGDHGEAVDVPGAYWIAVDLGTEAARSSVFLKSSREASSRL